MVSLRTQHGPVCRHCGGSGFMECRVVLRIFCVEAAGPDWIPVGLTVRIARIAAISRSPQRTRLSGKRVQEDVDLHAKLA